MKYLKNYESSKVPKEGNYFIVKDFKFDNYCFDYQNFLETHIGRISRIDGNDYITYTDPNHDYYLQLDVRRKDNKYLILDNSFDDLRAFSMVDIEYVHQLQNLYFALTGKELKYEKQS